MRSKYPILADTAAVIADPIVRNLATVCGNLAHGDPANDHPATMLALGAEVVATGPEGRADHPDRAVLHRHLHDRARSPTEVLTEIRIPAPPAGSGGAYVKLERKVGDFATAGAAAFLVLKGGVDRARRDRPHQRGPHADQGHARRRSTWPARSPTRPPSRRPAAWPRPPPAPAPTAAGAVEYKKEMARVLTVRALRKAAQRAGGK